MKHEWRNITVGLLAAVALSACGGGGGGGGGAPGPTAEEWLLFAEDGSAGSNNLSVFKASASSPIQVPIPQEGQTLSFSSLPLGEIHFANGKAFVVITSGLTGPAPDNLPSGGLAVIDLDTPNSLETTVVLTGTQTGGATRIVHAYVDPEGKFLWTNNDGPSGDVNADSVFRVNVDPTDTDASDPGGKYLDILEIPVGNGHKKSAFSRPSQNKPTARKLFITSSLTERRIDIIDDDPNNTATYGTVIKTIRNVSGLAEVSPGVGQGSAPHGFDYAPNAGRAFSGLTSGGVISIDTTSDDIVNIPDFDCATHSDCNDGSDQSVTKLTTGLAPNDALFAGYVHVHTNSVGEDTVYTTGRDGTAAKGFLTAINAAANTVTAVIDLGDMSASNFTVSHLTEKLYVPSSGGGTINDQVKVVDVNHNSATHNQVINTITVGTATGENRNIHASPDGRIVMVPNTSTNTVSVIDTETDAVIDTLTLTTGTTAGNVRLFKLPFDAEDNH